jgi:hypothetical protein
MNNKSQAQMIITLHEWKQTMLQYAPFYKFWYALLRNEWEMTKNAQEISLITLYDWYNHSHLPLVISPVMRVSKRISSCWSLLLSCSIPFICYQMAILLILGGDDYNSELHASLLCHSVH